MGMLFIFLVIVIGCQYLFQYFLSSVLGLNFIWVNIITDLVFSFIYAFIEYYRNKNRFKTPGFYKRWGTIFGLFTCITVLEFVMMLFLYGFLPLSFIWIALIMDFIVAVIFGFINYPGEKKYAIKDPRFHSTIAVYFAVMALYTVLNIYVS